MTRLYTMLTKFCKRGAMSMLFSLRKIHRPYCFKEKAEGESWMRKAVMAPDPRATRHLHLHPRSHPHSHAGSKVFVTWAHKPLKQESVEVLRIVHSITEVFCSQHSQSRPSPRLWARRIGKALPNSTHSSMNHGIDTGSRILPR